MAQTAACKIKVQYVNICYSECDLDNAHEITVVNVATIMVRESEQMIRNQCTYSLPNTNIFDEHPMTGSPLKVPPLKYMTFHETHELLSVFSGKFSLAKCL